MNTDSTMKASQTDWEALEQMDDDEIDLGDTPEVMAEQMKRATLRVGGEPISRGKIRINIYLDAEIVDHFKAKAGGRGYQTLINEALRDSMRSEEIESVLRRVIREELSNDHSA